MKAEFGAALKACAVLLASACYLPAAHAYMLDVKVGQVKLSNSGDAAELAAMEAAAGAGPLTLDAKQDVVSAMIYQNPGTTDQWYMNVGPLKPGYFLLKLGIGGTTATANAFLFRNTGDLTKLVWSNAQVQYLTGGNCGAHNLDACNIGRVSHYTAFDCAPADVPEPATLALLGAGLLGAFGVRRRKA